MVRFPKFTVKIYSDDLLVCVSWLMGLFAKLMPGQTVSRRRRRNVGFLPAARRAVQRYVRFRRLLAPPPRSSCAAAARREQWRVLIIINIVLWQKNFIALVLTDIIAGVSLLYFYQQNNKSIIWLPVFRLRFYNHSVELSMCRCILPFSISWFLGRWAFSFSEAAGMLGQSELGLNPRR